MIHRGLFWNRWLMVVAAGMTAFGLGMAFFNQTGVFAPFSRQIDTVFWPDQGLPAGVAAFQSWVYGAWGATVAGLGVFAFYLARHAFAAREAWARNSLVVSLLAWYLPDTFISILSRLAFNAIFNTIVLFLALLPAVAVRRDFRVV